MDPTSLRRLRAMAETRMTDSCVIQRVTSASDGAGGWSDTWAAAGAVDCWRRTELGPEEQVVAGRLGIASPWMVVVAHGTDVQVADRLSISGDTLEAAQVAERTSEVVRKVLCREVA